MEQKIFPLGNRVVLQTENTHETEQKTPSGFIISTQEKEVSSPKIATVTEIGPDVKNIQKGDRVVFKEFIPTVFEIEKEKYLLLSEDDILAKLI